MVVKTPIIRTTVIEILYSAILKNNSNSFVLRGRQTKNKSLINLSKLI